LRFAATLPLLLLSSLLLLTFAAELKITAKKVVNKNSTILYEGDVVVKYQNQTLICDKLIAHTGKNNTINLVLAIGNVTYTSNATLIYSDNATFYPLNKTALFEGNVLVKTDKGVSKGDRLLYLLDSGYYELTGKNGVQTVINMGKLKTPENAPKTGQNNTAR